MSEYENQKMCYRKSLKPILRKYITRKQYGDFMPIIAEVFQRRAYEYEFSDDEMKEQVKNFAETVATIEFRSKTEMGNPNVAGTYYLKEQKIALNFDYFLSESYTSEEKMVRILYEVFSHEAYHAINDLPDSSGLQYYDEKEQSWKGVALDEIFTETAADRASFSRTPKDAENYRTKTIGYSDITFVTNLLAASVGLTEKQILKAGIQSREELMKVIASQFEDKERFGIAKGLFDKLEASLDMIYNLSYHKNTEKLPAEQEMRVELLTSSLTNLYNSAFLLAANQVYQMKNPPLDKMMADVQYRYLKMNKIMEDSLEDFEEFYGSDVKEKVMEQTVLAKSRVARQLEAFDELNKFGIKNPELEESRHEIGTTR